jgi:hypothetical protein
MKAADQNHDGWLADWLSPRRKLGTTRQPPVVDFLEVVLWFGC